MSIRNIHSSNAPKRVVSDVFSGLIKSFGFFNDRLFPLGTPLVLIKYKVSSQWLRATYSLDILVLAGGGVIISPGLPSTSDILLYNYSIGFLSGYLELFPFLSVVSRYLASSLPSPFFP